MDIIRVKEIAQLLYFYQNRETYIKMKNKKLGLESEQADKGVVDIEEEQSGDIV